VAKVATSNVIEPFKLFMTDGPAGASFTTKPSVSGSGPGKSRSLQ
jgi:hypothetical protein